MKLDLGLLILRVAIGGVILTHGLIKIGWPISMGMRGLAAVRGTAGFFGGLGFWPPLFWALAAMAAEIGGSLLIILGLGGPLGPAIVFGDMVIVTLTAHWPYGWWAASPKGVGVEFPIPLAAGALALTLTGHGGWALDAAWGLSYPAWLTPAVLILAVAGDLVLLAVRALRRSSRGEPASTASGAA